MGEEKILSSEELDKVAGGYIHESNNLNDVYTDDPGEVIGQYDTLEKAKFAASRICPRCGKTFSDISKVNKHIQEWAKGIK